MSRMLERKASALNGLIIFGGCVLGAFEATRLWGIAIAFFMGTGLIFSGWANFCGWYRILGPRRSEKTCQSSFWIGGRDAHIKGVSKHYSSQINEAISRAYESASDVDKKQHLDRADALCAERRQILETTKHAMY